jgi:hypothetical protein
MADNIGIISNHGYAKHFALALLTFFPYALKHESNNSRDPEQQTHP